MKENNEIFDRFADSKPFSVPEGYFEQLSSDVMNKIEQEKIEETPVITLWQKLRPYIYMTAMFVGIYFSLRMFSGLAKEINIQKEETAEIFSEEELMLSMFDTYSLYEYLETEEE